MHFKSKMVLKIWFFVIFVMMESGKCEDYDKGVIFTVYNGPSTFDWASGTNLTTLGCRKTGKFTFISHGWNGSKGVWIIPLKEMFKNYRGGCIIVLNWGKYSDDPLYPVVVMFHWKAVANTLADRLFRLEKEGVSPDDMHLYGHSLGARMVIDAGTTFGPGRIATIDACDPAGPQFESIDLYSDQKKAAKNVQCIHTSVPLGTAFYLCHQSWRMGNCGLKQPAANPLNFLVCFLAPQLCPASYESDLSHNLCNDFYINAFENEFITDNYYNCSSVIDPKALPYRFKMGYMETRKSAAIVGSIAAPTSIKPPYNGV